MPARGVHQSQATSREVKQRLWVLVICHQNHYSFVINKDIVEIIIGKMIYSPPLSIALGEG